MMYRVTECDAKKMIYAKELAGMPGVSNVLLSGSLIEHASDVTTIIRFRVRSSFSTVLDLAIIRVPLRNLSLVWLMTTKS